MGVVLAMATWSTAAGAEVRGPTAGGPDESIAQAYGPLKAGVTYSGAFDDTNYEDVDYLAVNVSKAGQTLEFTIANTTQSCHDPNDRGCPVYGTLMDHTDHQVGGDTSAAGTFALSGDTETFDWTFSQPGTYYLLMESDSDLPPGNPTYTARFVPATTGPSAPLVKSLRVLPHQRGTAVKSTLILGQPAARLNETLLAPRPRRRPAFVANLTRRNLAPGTYRLTIRLPGSYVRTLKRKHQLSLLLKVTVTGASGRRISFTRHVTLRR
jgi:hypothetical protein